MRGNSNVIHITRVNLDTISGFTTPFDPAELTAFSFLNPINFSEVEVRQYSTESN